MTTETAPKTTGNGRAATAPRQKATNPRRKKGEGQWALGYREPLNPNEQSKKDDHPLNVRARIENIYAKQGFASIDPNDLRGRFRWYGLYTQRRPGIDGGKTATLEPWELDDEYFMLRIRIDGGALTTEQLRVIGQISVECRCHRPAKRPAALDSHRGRSRDLAKAGGGRTPNHRGLR
jgi:sulfite reductase (ferredoxin)